MVPDAPVSGAPTGIKTCPRVDRVGKTRRAKEFLIYLSDELSVTALALGCERAGCRCSAAPIVDRCEPETAAAATSR